ncbi:spermidine synthase [Conexibacter sp. CPCC 206217]|uniref:spermidine synthase n=1 Tax=Conexibacter sp. CPCC 206217 TaxID=3064574 RepID=UPI0027162B61|nr:fused MFS/spermidine synthase [Conexibacter sp. CPCC 206217]MDO8210879.1 fused MFS/spermidine synthase [Conexibacter sp. CPCC 206217]
MASRSGSGSRSRGGGGGSGRRGGGSRAGGRAVGRRDDARWSSERVERQTPFALAEVVPEPERPWRRLLRLDGEDCSHVDLRDPTAIDFAYVRRFADLADVVAPPGAPLDVVHLGGGGFTLPRYVAATRPGSRSEIAEIDPELVELAREQLGLRTDRALRVRVADARAVMERRAPASADLVVLDAFHGTSVPEHLTTVEFLRAARRGLRPGGAFAANVIDSPPPQLARALAAGAQELFDAVAVVATRKVIRGRQGGNIVVLASAGGPLPLAELSRRALRGGVPELVVSGEELTRWLGGARALRDPVAPAQEAPPADGPPAASTARPPAAPVPPPDKLPG